MWVGIGNMSTILGLVCKYISLSISISIISMVLPFNYADYSGQQYNTKQTSPFVFHLTRILLCCVVRDIVFVLCGWITRSDGSNDHHTSRTLLLWILNILLKYFYFVFRYFYFCRQSTRGAVRRSGALLSTLICSIVRNKTKYGGPKCSVELPTGLHEVSQYIEEGLLLGPW